MRAEIAPYRLPLKRPWVAAAATLTERRGALLHLIDADGYEGWGDCAPLPSGGDPDTVLAALDECRRLADADFSDLPPEARWAVETAQADLAARRAGLPLWRHLGGTQGEVRVNAALGPLDDGCAARATVALQRGYAIGKIKVGLDDVDAELALLRALAAATEGNLKLRLDANRAWSDGDASRFLSAIADLPIDAVEEPLAHPTPAKFARLQAGLPYALAIDESLPRIGLSALIEARAVRRLILKPARLGGIAATQAVATKAQAADIAVVLTSVVDSAVGVTAAAHLATALAPDIAHGLSTSDWLAHDVAAPLPIVAGKMRLPDAPGLGIRPA